MIVSSRAVPANWRPALAVMTAGATLVLGLVWASTNSGELRGHVYETGCAGTLPRGAPAGSGCASRLLKDATVVASSADVALSVRSDSQGYYWLKLPAGNYLLAAWVNPWQEVSPEGIRSNHRGGASPFGAVRVKGGATLNVDISISFASA